MAKKARKSRKQRKYIARGGEVAWTGRAAYADPTLYVFAVRADPTLVHEMLTRYIDEPSQDLGLHVDVRGTSVSYVLFVFLDANRRQVLRGSGGGFEGAHQEQTFAVLTLGYRSGPDPGWVLFAPYVFASDTPGWQADREIYGFPRQHGDVEIRLGAGTLPTKCSVRANVIPRFGPGARSVRRTIVSIKKKSNANGRPIPRGAVAAQIEQALGGSGATIFPRSPVKIVPEVRRGATAADNAFFERAAAGSSQQKSNEPEQPLKSLSDALASGSLPMLFLKQFRDITFADRACYQAIVEAPFELGSDVTATVSDDYELHLKDIDSVPIGRELGIARGRTVPVEFCFRVGLNELIVGKASVISNPQWNPAIEFSIPDEPSRLVRYVDRGGDAVWRQPSLLHGARIYGFGVPVPAARQQALLTTFINNLVDKKSTYGSQPFHLRSCEGMDMVMLLFVEYDRITSGDAHDELLGGTQYREFLLMQLAISDDPEYPELDWFIPYICLDTDAPRLGGREIYGYPKQLARFSKFDLFNPGNVSPVTNITVDTTVFATSGSKEAGRNVPIVSVKGPATSPTLTPYQNAEDMFLDLFSGTRPSRSADVTQAGLLFPFSRSKTGAASQGPGVDVRNALLMNRIGNVFLKEFRDAEHPENFCYQAVCKTDTMPTQFHGGGRIDDPSGYRIRVADIASEPLRRYLNPHGRAGREGITPTFAYVLHIDFELTAGRVISNALADYDPSLDVSIKRTKAKKSAGQRPPVRRVPSFVEPYWAR